MIRKASPTREEFVVLRALRAALPAHLRNRSLTPELSLRDDLEMDSLAFASLVFTLEEELHVDLSAAAVHAANLRTVADLLSLAERVLPADARLEQKP
jgi:acyl carrier protein